MTVGTIGEIHNQKYKITENGASAVRRINKTGAPSVKGELVEPHATIDFAVDLTGADAYDCTGVFYESDIPDGEWAWVAKGGDVQVMIKDGTTAVAHSWVKTSDTAGRADASATEPSGGGFVNVSEHFKEIGHGVEAKSSGTSVLVTIDFHPL